jgi:2-polyprenyl-3-methyl-5-hydroxy-6-metoxy-1,4-benzoquinol methylase
MAAWLPNFQPAPASLLDYGCGLGDFMRQARLLGYTLEGFEISPVGREFCIRSGFHTYASTLDIQKEQYDIVTAIEVIEHAFSPSAMLNSVYRALRPGGIFLYTTGNIWMFEVKRALGLVQDWAGRPRQFFLSSHNYQIFQKGRILGAGPAAYEAKFVSVAPRKI